MHSFIDQRGKAIQLTAAPRRIISLVPSQTELLFDLGFDQEVVGITKFCVHPEVWHRTKARIGGTKDFWFDKIDELKPDLIIGNKEENYREGIERLEERYPVWMSDIATLDDALSMIRSVGTMVGRGDQARQWAFQIQHAFGQLIPKPPQSVLYLIWKNPWMGAGRNTFINSMLEKTGLVNCLSDDRYPELTDAVIKKLSPQVILLSSEPFPFQQKHINELQQVVPGTKIMLVDGEMFSWYGSRLVKAAGYFNGMEL